MAFQKLETRHGVPVYVFPMPHVQSVAVGVLVFAGSRDEIYPHEAGLAHAFEHMVFQGNTRLGSNKMIAEELEAHGGSVNAWTWNEMTFYHRVAPDYAFDVAVNSIASQITDSLFRPEDITKEMKNIVQEIRRSFDNPASFCGHLFDKAIFGNHPLGKIVLGSEETVSKFTRDDFLLWQNKFYYAGNYVFLVVGNIDSSTALKVFDRVALLSISRARNTRPLIAEISGAVPKIVAEREIEQAHIHLGTPIGPASETESKLLEFYTYMLDGGMSFPLFQEVRDKRGLCYAVSADVLRWSDRGVFQVYVGTDAARVNEATDCVKEVVWNYRRDEALLERTKKMINGRNAISFSNPSSVLQRAAVDVVFSGSPQSPEEIRQEIDGFMIDEIAAVVEKYLRPENFSYAYVIPKGAQI